MGEQLEEKPIAIEHPILPDAFAMEEEAARPQHVNRASSICHPCPYFGFLARTRWAERAPISEWLLRVFAIGRKVELETRAAMLEAGLEINRAQETLKWDDLQLTGHHDGIFEARQVVRWMSTNGMEPAQHLVDDPNALCIWDVKSQDPATFGKWRSIEDMLAPLAGPSVYHWQYPGQLSLYASHQDVRAAWCCIYFVNRSTYETRQVWWPADHPLAVREVESAKNACRWVNWALAHPDEDVADKLARPGRWCEGCAFRHCCERFLLIGDEVHVVEELDELVATRVSVSAFKSEVERQYNESNNRLKEIWKQRHAKHGDHEALCGDVLVRIKKNRRGHVRATYKAKGR